MRVLAWVGVALGLVVVLAALAVAFPGLWLGTVVEDRLEARLDRDVQVGAADLSLTPFKVTLRHLKVANPAWAEPPWLLEVARLDAFARPGDLLSGDLVFRRWEMEHPTVHLVRDPQNGLSWSPEAGDGGTLPVEQLVLSGGRLTYSAPARDTRISGSFGSRPAQERLHVAMSGTWRGKPARLDGWTARLLDLRGADEVPIGFDLAVGDTTVVGEGTLSDLTVKDGPYYEVRLAATGPDLQAWDAIAGAVLPSSPPYDLQGRLTWDGQRYAFREANGSIGESIVSGGITVRPDTVTVVSGRIGSAHLEMADVLALGGANGGRVTGLLPERLSLDLRVQAGDLVMPGQTLKGVKTRVTLKPGRLAVAPFTASLDGREVNGHLTVDETAGDGPTAVDVALEGDQTRLIVQGTVQGTGQPDARRVDLQVAAKGPHLRLWQAVTGADLPATPAYDIQGRLGGTLRRILVEDLSATIGHSHLAGRLVVQSGPVTQVSGHIHAPHLTAGDVVAIGGTGKGEGGDLLPDGLGLDVDVTVETLETAWRTVEEIDTHVRLLDGRLSVEPLTASIGGGRVEGRLALEGARAPPVLALNLDLKRLEMQDTLGRFEVTKNGLTGLYGGRVEVAGPWQGGLDGWLGGLGGKLRLVMSDGTLGTDVLKKAGLGLGDIFGGGNDQPARIRCALIEATARDGVLTPDRAVLSATSAVVTADGSVDLARRSLDLVLQVQPREGAGLQVVGPVAVTGPLTSPRVDVGVGPGVAKAVAGLGLAAFATPLAGLLPLIDMGPGDAVGCRDMLTRTQEAGTEGPTQEGAD